MLTAFGRCMLLCFCLPGMLTSRSHSPSSQPRITPTHGYPTAGLSSCVHSRDAAWSTRAQYVPLQLWPTSRHSSNSVSHCCRSYKKPPTAPSTSTTNSYSLRPHISPSHQSHYPMPLLSRQFHVGRRTIVHTSSGSGGSPGSDSVGGGKIGTWITTSTHGMPAVAL